MRYQDIYPSDALLRSFDVERSRATELLNLEYLEADSAGMPTAAFDQHHLLLNLQPRPTASKTGAAAVSWRRWHPNPLLSGLHPRNFWSFRWQIVASLHADKFMMAGNSQPPFHRSAVPVGQTPYVARDKTGR